MNRCRGSTTLSKRCRRILPTGQSYCPTHIGQEHYILINDTKNENIEQRFKIMDKMKRPPIIAENQFILKQMATRDKYIAFIFVDGKYSNAQFWTKLKNNGWTIQNNKYINKDKVAIVLSI